MEPTGLQRMCRTGRCRQRGLRTKQVYEPAPLQANRRQSRVSSVQRLPVWGSPVRRDPLRRWRCPYMTRLGCLDKLAALCQNVPISQLYSATASAVRIGCRGVAGVPCMTRVSSSSGGWAIVLSAVRFRITGRCTGVGLRASVS